MTQDLYRWFDKDDNLLYVGISLSAATRARSHKSRSPWYRLGVKMLVEKFPDRKSVLLAESRAIRDEHPLYNRTLYGRVQYTSTEMLCNAPLKRWGGSSIVRCRNSPGAHPSGKCRLHRSNDA